MKSLEQYILESKNLTFKTTWNKFWHFRFDKDLNEKLTIDDFDEYDQYQKYGLMTDYDKLDDNEIDTIETSDIFKNYCNDDEISVESSKDRNSRSFVISYKGKRFNVIPLNNINQLEFIYGEGEKGLQNWINKIEM